MKQRIAFFGGGFNPPHIAHVMGIAYAKVMGRFDRIFVLPCWQHAFDKDSNLIDFDHRMKMAERAFSRMSDVFVSSMERTLQTRYTVDLMEKIQPNYPKEDFDLFLIIGSDNLQVMHSWHRWQDLGALVEFFVMPRPGSSELPFSLPDVSSTEVRDALARGDLATASSMLPPSVLDYIRTNKLYGWGLPEDASK